MSVVQEDAAFAYQDGERTVLFTDICSHSTGNAFPEGSTESRGSVGSRYSSHSFGKEKKTFRITC